MRDIQFRKLSIKNFLSIGNDPVEISFTPGLHLITGINKDKDGRRNGVGKSTVMDAIHWILFGTTLRDINKGTISNFNTKGQCLGVLEFSVCLNGQTTEYKVARLLSPSKCILTVNDVDSTLSTIAKTNEFIESVLGFTSTLFKNSVVLSINNTQAFLAQDKITKRKFIEGIFNLEVFGDILADVRQKSIEIKKSIDVLQAKIDAKQQNVNLYTGQKDVFDKQQVDKRVGLIADKNEVIGRINSLKSKLISVDELVIKQDALKKRRNDIISNIQSIEDVVSSNKNEIQTINYQIKDTENKREMYVSDFNNKVSRDVLVIENKKCGYIDGITNESKIKKIKIESEKATYIKDFENTNKTRILILEKELHDYIQSTKETICPTCKRPLTEKIAVDQSKIDKLNEEIRSVKSKTVDSKIISDFDDRISRESVVNIDKSVISEFDKQIEDAKKSKPDQSIIVVFNTQISQLRDKIQDINTKIEDGNKQITRLKDMGILKINETLEGIQDTITSNNKTCVEIEFNNRQLKQIEDQIEGIDKAKNPFIDMLSDASIQLQSFNIEMVDSRKLYKVYETAKFVVSEEGVKTYIIKKLLNLLNSRIDYYLRKLDSNSTCVFNEYFEECIKNDRGIECSYFNFSGAEMKTIDLACLFAFMDLRRMQGDVSINISMYDELFDSSFDEKGLDHVTNILKERVLNNKEAVYVISHRKESLKSVTGEVIILEKVNGVTRRITNA